MAALSRRCSIGASISPPSVTLARCGARPAGHCRASALMVGHNPGLEDLVLLLVPARDGWAARPSSEEKYPTGTVRRDWRSISTTGHDADSRERRAPHPLHPPARSGSDARDRTRTSPDEDQRSGNFVLQSGERGRRGFRFLLADHARPPSAPRRRWGHAWERVERRAPSFPPRFRPGRSPLPSISTISSASAPSSTSSVVSPAASTNSSATGSSIAQFRDRIVRDRT